jgi:small subunit ribosomal protein S9
MSAKGIFAVGRRKTSIARVKLSPGSGKVVVNGKPPEQYFSVARLRAMALSGLQITGTAEKFDVNINVLGGGITGQAGAVRMGIARALQFQDAALRPHLKKAGHLTRDSRMVERKKYGRHKARRGTQFSKR